MYIVSYFLHQALILRSLSSWCRGNFPHSQPNQLLPVLRCQLSSTSSRKPCPLVPLDQESHPTPTAPSLAGLTLP